MRIALVSPYSFTYPGGVGRHVEALAQELLQEGHDVRLLAPYDPDDRKARVSHRGARPEARPVPDYLIPMGRTVGVPSNGSVSNLAVTPESVARVGRELRTGGYDVVHVHEPNVPVVSWYAVEAARAPVVGTFHCYSTSAVSNNIAVLIGARRLYNKLHARIAVSQAARWTAERFYGGRYRIIPNGVDLASAMPTERPANGRPLNLLFLGRAEERKGLPVLLRAYEGLRAVGVDARLTVAGATHDEVEPFLMESEGIEVAGRVTEDQKWKLLGEADLLCAPSLGGESFGMVLTEAFASGTPVVCSDIAGYRDVARDGLDGVLVPAGDPTAFGEALHDLALDPERRRTPQGVPRGAEGGRFRLRRTGCRADRPGPSEDRDRADRECAPGGDARMGARRVRADVRVHAHASGGVARGSPRGASGRSRAPTRRGARHDDRGAHVGHAAGSARRAVARADRGPPGRAGP